MISLLQYDILTTYYYEDGKQTTWREHDIPVQKHVDHVDFIKQNIEKHGDWWNTRYRGTTKDFPCVYFTKEFNVSGDDEIILTARLDMRGFDIDGNGFTYYHSHEMVIEYYEKIIDALCKYERGLPYEEQLHV